MSNVLLWICQIFLAVVFVYSGAMKSTQSEEKLVAMGQTGVENLPQVLIRFIGISEILGVVGIILPRLTGIMPVLTPLAAIGFGIIMILAAIVHFRRKRKDDRFAESFFASGLRVRGLRQIRVVKLTNVQTKKRLFSKMMRLKPIENPGNLFVKMAYWWSRREFGKVIMPMKVIYARPPKLMFLANKIYQFQEKNVLLEPSLRLLIQTQVSMLNGCSFCNDISLAQAVRKKLGAEKFFALGDDIETKTKSFTEKERAVIAFVNEYAKNSRISDETFESGNNRTDSLKNIIENPQIALLFFVPNVSETFRVNGTAQISVAPDLLEQFGVEGKPPKTVLIVTVREAFVHCSRALVRSRLWSPEKHFTAANVPSIGTILAAHTGGKINAEEYDAQLKDVIPQTLY